MNHTTRSAKDPFLRTGIFAALRGVFSGGRGSGAPSLRRLGLAVLVAAALFSIFASSAFASRNRVLGEAFGSAGQGAGQLELASSVAEHPASGVAVNETTGNVYVADTGNLRVDQFTSGGTFVRAWGWGVEDGAAELETCTTASGCRQGLAGTGAGQFNHPIAIAVDNAPGGEGDVYVADWADALTGENYVQKFSAEGALLTSWGEGGRLTEGALTEGGFFARPSALGVDSVGNLWAITASGLYNFERSDKYIRETAGVGGEAVALVLNAAEEPYIAEGGRVEKRDLEGTKLGTVYEPPSRIAGLAVATAGPATGELFVAEGESIATVAPGCAPAASPPFCPAASHSSATGHLTEGAGLAFDSSSETLYAADSAAEQILTFIEEEPGPPTVEPGSNSVTEVNASSAGIEAELNPRSEAGEAPTTYFFEYGPCATPATCALSPYAFKTPSATLPPDFEAHPVTAHLSGLQPGTAYHLRLAAENSHNPGVPVIGAEATFTTQTTGAFSLPDSRRWEMVSPPNKLGAAIQPMGSSGVVEAAADGSALTYRALTPSEAETAGFAGREQLLSVRGAAAWSTRDLGIPHPAAAGSPIGQRDTELVQFSPELSAAVQQPLGPFNPALSSEASESTAYLRDLSGSCGSFCYQPLVTGKPGFANVPEGTHFGEDEKCTPQSSGTAVTGCGPAYYGASEDLTRVVLKSRFVGLTSNPEDHGGLYEWSNGSLRQVSILPGGQVVENQAFRELGSEGSRSARGAISADGSRVFWRTQSGNSIANYLRYNATEEQSAVLGGECVEPGKACTLQIDAAEAGCGSCKSGGGEFQFATADGSRVFFTDLNPLTAVSGAESGAGGHRGDLYECRIVTASSGALECDLTDLTPKAGSETAALPGNILGASADGSYVYFVAEGIESANSVDNGAGPESAEAGQPNLYLTRDGVTTFITSLSDGDSKDWSNLATQPTRVSSDGQWLELMSERSLTDYDNRDLATGKPVAEVYLYHVASGTLLCVSCDPTGARPKGVEYFRLVPDNGGLVGGGGKGGAWLGSALVAAVVPGWTDINPNGGEARYQDRYLSDSGRLFFNALGGLVPKDSNGTFDVYQYEPPGVGGCSESSPTFGRASGGCVDLISLGSSGQESAFLDASESGDDVFFLTAAKLKPQDEDAAYDVYDAHVCSASSPCLPEPPPPAPACEGDACQQPANPPDFESPGTALLNGPENAVECAKGKVKKSGKCIAKHHKKKHPKKNHKAKKSHTKRSANDHRRASR